MDDLTQLHAALRADGRPQEEAEQLTNSFGARLLRGAARHLRAVTHLATYDDAGQRTAEGVLRAATAVDEMADRISLDAAAPLTPVNPDRPCPHLDFDAYVMVNRRTKSDTDPTVIAFSADIKVNCKDCGEPFRWTGLQAGLSPRRPMCSLDETELRAPLRPASADPDFGTGLPGYAVSFRPGPAATSPQED